MTIVYADEFRKQFHRLPADIQEAYQSQEKLFVGNWRDSRLHIKKLIGQPVYFSFRVTRRYRVIFMFIEQDTALFATVVHRKDAYRD